MMGAGDDAQYASALYNLQPLQCCVNIWGAQHGVLQFPSSLFQLFPFFHARPALSLREHHFRLLLSNTVAFAFCLHASIGVFTFASITGDRGATFKLTVYRRASCTSKWGLKNVVMSMTWQQLPQAPRTRPWSLQQLALLAFATDAIS